MKRQSTTWLAGGAVVALGALLTLITGPRTPHLDETAGGDGGLAARVRTAIDDDRGYQSLHVSEITADDVRHAGIGSLDPQAAPTEKRAPSATDPMELGSITKTFNGMLLADAITRGEVSPGDRLDRYLPELAGSAIGAVSLEELATHRAAVPPLPPSTLARAVLTTFTNGNPYASDTRTSVLAQVKTMPLMGSRGTVQYSNLGGTLLGWALAAAAGQSEWEDYVRQRLLAPLGLTHTVFAATPQAVPAGAVPGWTDNGRRAAQWVSPAFRPAGSSTWTTAEDVTRYAQAVLRGTAPGMAALEPRFDVPDAPPAGSTRIGYHWFTTTIGGRSGAWHDGGTGGFRTMLLIDRDAGRAVLVMGNTSRGVEPIAVRLLTGVTTDLGDTRAPPPITGLIIGGVGLVLVAGFAHRALRASSRAQLVGSAAGAVTGLALTRALGPWGFLPGWVWGALLGVAMVALAIAGRAWRHVPWRAPRRRILRELSAGLGVAIAVLAVAVVR